MACVVDHVFKACLPSMIMPPDVDLPRPQAFGPIAAHEDPKFHNLIFGLPLVVEPGPAPLPAGSPPRSPKVGFDVDLQISLAASWMHGSP